MDRDYVTINRDIWDAEAAHWVAMGAQRWALEAPIWGNWGAAEAALNLLPADLAGKDAIELGCGTGYVSGWMARRGARVTGIDISSGQLATARQLAEQHETAATFIEGNAEATGLAEASFDFAISEYGAAIWCKPDAWLREAWRLLRPGGRLVFLGNHPLVLVCSPLNGAPCDATLHRPYRDMWGGGLDPSRIRSHRGVLQSDDVGVDGSVPGHRVPRDELSRDLHSGPRNRNERQRAGRMG